MTKHACDYMIPGMLPYVGHNSPTECPSIRPHTNTHYTGFDTGFFARVGNRIFEEIFDIFVQQSRRIQL